MTEKLELAPSVRAILFEIQEALQRFIDNGERWSIFINKMSLMPEERQAIRDYLGQGSIKINLINSAEPAEWIESNVSGVWYGVFYDQTNHPVLETIEIGAFPEVPSAHIEDVKTGAAILKQHLV